MSADAPSPRIIDPRAVRVAVASGMVGLEAGQIVLEPVAVPLLAAAEPSGDVLLDGVPTRLRLEWRDVLHAVLVEGDGNDVSPRRVVLLPLELQAGPARGVVRREVMVDGWRIEVEVESERRAALRDRARRGREEVAHGGPTEVHAIIPGRVVSVSIVPGDSVVAGQQLLVVEAMKMQNELRAPRDGVILRLAVGQGQTIEVGDLMLVLE